MLKNKYLRFGLGCWVVGLLWLSSSLAWAAPKIEHWTTKQGLRVYYVAAPDLPMLDLRLVFAAGSARDGDKDGLANLTSSMLDQGADGMSADAIASSFDAVGAGFSSGSARDMAWISLRTLTLEPQQTKAFSTWLRILKKPDFPANEFKNLQKLILVGLAAERQSPEDIANKAFYKNLYGDHPYAHPSSGTEDSVNALTLNDLQHFYQQYFVRQNAILAIVGAVDRTQAEQMANQIADALGDGVIAPPLPEVAPLQESKTELIEFPSEQSHILMGSPSIKRGDLEQYALSVGNHILGGGDFTSRLVKEVRQQRGLSYSVYSYFLSMAQAGPFQIGLQTKRDKTKEALDVVRKVVQDFLDQGPTAAELEAAKKDITGSFPMGSASNSDIIGQLGSIGFYDLPLDYLDTYVDKINAITHEDVMNALRHYIDPNKMITVIVGQTAEANAEGSTDADSKTETKSQDSPTPK